MKSEDSRKFALFVKYGGCFFEIVIFSHSRSDLFDDHGVNLVVYVLQFTEWIIVYI